MRNAVVVLLTCYILALFCGIATVHAAEEPISVCIDVNETTDECDEWASVLEGVSSIEDIGFSPDSIVYMISWGLALVLGIGLLGFGIGAIWRFFDAALGGPLS